MPVDYLGPERTSPAGIPIHIVVDVDDTTLVNVAPMIVIITVRRAFITKNIGILHD